MDEDRDRILELLWQNGPVTQSQRSINKSTPSDLGPDLIPADQSTRHRGRPQNLFVQEDEMASWLHYPLNDTAFPSEFCSDLLYSSPPCVNAAGTMTAVPISLTNASASASAPLRIDNFGQFSRSRRFDESGPSNSNRAVKESTVLNSSATPAVPPQLRVPDVRERLHRGITSVAASVSVPAASLTGLGSEAPACDASVTSSLGGSTESADPPTPRKVPIALPEDRKRKGQEPDCDGGDCHSEDDELGDGKKPLRCCSSSTRKSRAAEVHNLSERKRRDRINERMKTLQELIPNCNKADKASMLDEAIEYLKSLQLTLQMISMGGCSSMVPTMMYPAPHGVPHQQQQQQQHYIIPQQHIAGMGMGIGINHPMMMMMPFPNNNVLTAAAAAAAAGSVGVAHHMLTPRFPMQPPMFHNMPQQLQNVAVAGGVADPAAARFPFLQPGGGSYHDPTMLSTSSSNSNPVVINPNMADPLYHHHQYLSTLHHLQIPPHPNQEMQHSSRSKVKASENLEHLPKG